MYNEEGELFWQRTLDSYGKTRMEKGNTGSCNFAYQGQVIDDDVNLYYNRFRWYDQEEGVYISQDPISIEGGLNIYAYVADPNLEIDPFGESPTSTPRHHLIPQEMMKDPDFMRQLKSIGIKDPRTYVHRQTADITEGLHKQIHKGAGGGKWNSDFKDWYSRNSSFSKRDLQKQIRKMMQEHNIPRSSRNFARRYGRKTSKKVGYK